MNPQLVSSSSSSISDYATMSTAKVFIACSSSFPKNSKSAFFPHPSLPSSSFLRSQSLVLRPTSKSYRNNVSTLFTSKRRAQTSTVTCSAERISPAKALRLILESPGVHQGPAVFDALSAKLVERAGFDFCFTSGFSISAARSGLPDTGFLSYGEMVDQGRQITEAVSIPVIGDGDNGYGNAMNVKRTVKGYIRAGFAGIILEDQVSPKACGHTRGRKVVSREEAVMKIKAAVDAREEAGSDIVLVARTDSRQAVSLEESLWRSRAFADAGADVLFIDALSSREEMKAFCEISPLVPKLANMLEGGGKTPILTPYELAEVGYKIVAYPLSLIGVSIRAMQDSLLAIKGGRMPPPGSMPSFEEMKEILGFNTYYEEEKRYVTSTSQMSRQRDLLEPNTLVLKTAYSPDYASPVGPKEIKAKGALLVARQLIGPWGQSLLMWAVQEGYSAASSNVYGIQRTEDTDPGPQDPVVEVITPEVYRSYGGGSSGGPFSGIWSRTLRIKITGRDGFEKLDIRIPAGFLEGITNIVPALGGVNFKELLDDAAEEVGGKLLLDFNDTMGDRIQVFLE